jgi:hypothetical protein
VRIAYIKKGLNAMITYTAKDFDFEAVHINPNAGSNTEEKKETEQKEAITNIRERNKKPSQKNCFPDL